ncbi:MAG: hypothetical protein HQL07_01365 [Nitrospirae bacterium]|nr:hypothetical protein [Magnetococcales bacterium]
MTDWYPIQTLAAGYSLVVSQSLIAASDLSVSQDVSTLYNSAVTQEMTAPYPLMVAQDLMSTYALSIAIDFPAYYRAAEIVSQALEGLWGITCASESIAGFYVPVCAELHCPSRREINSLVLAWWGKQSDVSRQIVAPYAYIVGEVGAELSARYEMLAYNPVSSAITGYWNILQDTGSQFRPLDFSVVHKGVPL